MNHPTRLALLPPPDAQPLPAIGAGASTDADEARLIANLARLKQRTNAAGISIVITAPDHQTRREIAHRLEEILGLAGIPGGVVHLFRWWDQLVCTPGILRRNRYDRRRVLIFERTIYDNIARLCYRIPGLRAFTAPVLRLVRLCYPRFDHRFYIARAADKPAPAPNQAARLAELSRRVARATEHEELPADQDPIWGILLRLT